MVEEEYEAKTKTIGRVLYIEIAAEEPRIEKYAGTAKLRVELKDGAEDWDIESVAERLTEISAIPLAFRLATEADIEVKVKGKRGKRK